MSQRERDRLALLSRVRDGQMTLQEASRLLSVSYRQVKRLWGRYRREGDAGVVHGLRGRASNNRSWCRDRREQAVALYREHYQGMGPTLAAEQLQERHGLTVNHETLRGWLASAGLWRVRGGRAARHRRWRPRRSCFGELVQMDGSDHDWFGPEHRRATLMVMVDDATGWTWAQFFACESLPAALSVVRDWVSQHGRPVGLYTDRHSIYRRSDKAAVEHWERTGKHLPTQWGQAMGRLGIELHCAHSPQAKGRVERANGVLQDRLVKLLELEGITDPAAANAYLREHYLPAHNARFARPPAEQTDAHRPGPSRSDLDEALSQRALRVVGKDGCVCWQGRWMQLQNPPPRTRGSQVEVRQYLDGRVELWVRDQRLTQQALPKRPTAKVASPSLRQRVAKHAKPWQPPSDHPWKQSAQRQSAKPASGGRRSAPAADTPPAARPRCARPPRGGRTRCGKGTVLLG